MDSPIKIKNDESLPRSLIKKCEIEFKNVSFIYENTRKSSKKINLEIEGMHDCFCWS